MERLDRIERWDRRFLGLCDEVGSWSKDPSTQQGSVIVKPVVIRNRTKLKIVSLGFNGFPSPVSDHEDLYADRPTKLARVIHAEMNAILHATEPLEDCIIYGSPMPPCDRCAAHIIQAGISTIVSYDEPVPERWAESAAQAERMYSEAGIEIRVWPR